MHRTILSRGVCALMICAAVACASAKEPEWNKVVVFDGFRSEGACFGDFNHDGVADVVSGHYWYAGPDFKEAHQFMKGEDSYSPESYSNSFVNFASDVNGDGWDDIIICPHPGVDGFWYLNPKKDTDEFWEEKALSKELGGETQVWDDVDGDGAAELVFNRIGNYGYAKPKADGPWDFVSVSGQDDAYQRYYEGSGVGDINGDGRADLVERRGWYEQPEKLDGTPWKFHEFPFAEAGCNMIVYDFNNDGLNDVVSAWHCHEYGLVCWLQKRDANGEISFEAQWIIPKEPADDFSPKVSQLHAIAMGDFNQDGVMDFVTGKRYFAHGSAADADPLAPPQLLWFETVRGDNGAVSFVPHIIDDESGVGTQVWAQDVNGDNTPDIVVGNKKVLAVFMSK